jgi:hypothetical protein
VTAVTRPCSRHHINQRSNAVRSYLVQGGSPYETLDIDIFSYRGEVMNGIVAACIAIIGLSFFLLSAYIIAGSVRCFKRGDGASVILGAGLILTCLVVSFACFAAFRSLL